MDNALPISLVATEQPKKVKKFFKVIKSDICVGGKFIPEGSIIDFFDESLSGYLTPAYPVNKNEIFTAIGNKNKANHSSAPLAFGKRKRGRPRKLENIIEVAV